MKSSLVGELSNARKRHSATTSESNENEEADVEEEIELGGPEDEDEDRLTKAASFHLVTATISDIVQYEKDWVDHINTVNHTAACRDLRNKYPDWKPGLKSKSRVEPHRLHARPYFPQDHCHHHFTGDSSHHSGLKRPHNDLKNHSADTNWDASISKVDQRSKHGTHDPSTKTVKKSTKPGTNTNKTESDRAADPLSNPPPCKKKKKNVAPTSQNSTADRLVYLTGIPKEASEHEVTKFVSSYGKINNVILLPCSEEESEKGHGQKASVCMVKAADAQALINSTNLTIGDQPLTASCAKIPEPKQSSVPSNSKPIISPDMASEKKDCVSEADMSTSAKGLVLITGIPDGDWSESDVIKLIQPFGNPTDIISVPSIGKALVSVPDLKTAEEVVKVHTTIPAKIKDCELKMINVKEHIGIDTPVALYNLLMQSLDPLESSSSVNWSSLLVINNVPDTPSGLWDVKQLVCRFGTVVKTLELCNMVICEMATRAMALSVLKRFERFPCIIQNNPLFFSRKPDPKASTQTPVLSPNLHLPEDIPANDETCSTGAADQDEKAYEEIVSAEMEKGPDILMDPEKLAKADEVIGENRSLVTQEPRNVLSEDALEPDKKTDKDNISTTKAILKSDEQEASSNGTILQTTANAAQLEKNKTHVGQYTSTEVAISEFSEDTPEVHTGGTASNHPNKMAASENGDEVHLETEEEKVSYQTKDTHKVVDETKGTVNYHAEDGLKTQEREGIDKEIKERECKVSERRAQEKSQTAKWDQEEEERTKRERTEMERKKEHSVVSSGLTSSSKFETFKSNLNAGEQRVSSESDAELTNMDEGEDFDLFPSIMSDFVTVDEVGDVTDLNDFPHTHSPATPEKTKEQEHSLTDLPQDTDEVPPLEVNEEEITRPLKFDDPIPDLQHQPLTSEDPITDFGRQPTTSVGTSDSVSSDMIGTLSCKIVTPSTETPDEFPPVSQKEVPTCPPEENETETILPAPMESLLINETFATPISNTTVTDDSPSDQHTIEVKMTLGNNTGEEKQEEVTTVVNSPLKDGNIVMDQIQGKGKVNLTEDTTESLPSDQTVSSVNIDIPTTTEEKSGDKPLTKTLMAADNNVHFDPSIPVGMEFLVPKTGFFCKVCNRFFIGNKDTQITHCKSLKHFENMQKYLETKKTKRQ
ncbi:uncharacterized protein LOC144020227 isoform X2 [Festucalex cinctus]